MTRLLCPILLLAIPILARAGILDFTPVLQSELIGNTLNVEILALYTGGEPQPALGSYDAKLSFNPSLLSAPSVEFSTMLGDPLTFDVVTKVNPAPGVLNLSATSNLFGSILIGFQGPIFPLALVTFNSALMEGSIDPNLSLEENFGLMLEFSSLSGAEECPEPAVYALVGAGLLVILRKRRISGCLRAPAPAKRDAGAERGAFAEVHH
jgi:hypothetical protein